MNKNRAVLEHLLEHKKITSLEAFELYGATRLSAIIYNLRHKEGYVISNVSKSCIDRYGHTCHYVEYTLEGDVNG